MSIIDIDSMTPSGVVAQYVIELFGAGHFLSRDDYSRLENWLKLSSSSDELLLVLDEILPDRIEKSRGQGKRLFSLASINRSVEKKLREKKYLGGGTSLGS